MSDSPGLKPRGAPPSSRPFQFSLRGMLILVTAVAVLLGLWVWMPLLPLFLGVVLIFAIFPTVLVTLAIYARGNLQTFAIGALVPFVLGMLPMEAFTPWSLAISPVTALCGGGVAVWLRRLIRILGWDQPANTEV